jgi:hypothetical protein
MRYGIGHVVILVLLPVVCLSAVAMPAAASDGGDPAIAKPGRPLQIERIAPQREGGQGYRLVYWVDVPPVVYWRFKTDFDNPFLVENKFILEHHVVERDGNTVVTENKYTNGPDVYYRWQTKILPQQRRLDFKLLNAEKCHQDYHYGYIQIDAVAGGTQVTQVAYFDFGGATLWTLYPWKGGMKDFLGYTARWERATVMRLKDNYHDPRNHP